MIIAKTQGQGIPTFTYLLTFLRARNPSLLNILSTTKQNIYYRYKSVPNPK